ncbi:MAG: hypothetical protein ACE37M_15020 [Henriciella sp.]
MKHLLLSAIMGVACAPWATAEIEWDEIPGAQADAYAIGKAQKTGILSQREILFCKAHWEGYSEAVSEQEMYRLFPPLTAEFVHGAVDYWAAKLEISDYDAELEIADAAYYALIHIGPSAEDKVEAARKLGPCAPGD